MPKSIPSDAELEAMAEAMATDAERNPAPAITAIRFDAPARTLVLSLPNGVELRAPLSEFPELAHATDEELAALRVRHGATIVQDALDVHISVEGLLCDLVMGKGWRLRMKAGFAAEAARQAGLARSAAKAAAARANGAKGGRPRKAIAQAAPVMTTHRRKRSEP